MANSAVYLDVNIAISKYRFNSAAFFEIVMFGLRKRFLLRVFIFQSTLHARFSVFPRILFMFKTGSQLLSFNRFSTLIKNKNFQSTQHSENPILSKYAAR